MCGICGLYSPSSEPQQTLVDGMRARIRHRGPDQGSTDAFGACVLGHQRLQVIDPELGYQPVADETGDDRPPSSTASSTTFRELRDELAAHGHEVRGRGDTPVIPHLYEEYGPQFVERLDGMFAIALWDAGRAAPRARARPARQEAARVDAPRRRHARVRVRAEGVPRAPELPRASPTCRALDAYLALQYVPGTRTGLRECTASSPARCSSPKATP